MATFTLDNATSGTLGGAQFKTQAFDMNGEFREIQFRWGQSSASQDAEPHFFEFHYTFSGVSMEDR